MLVDDDDAKKRLLDEGLKGRELRLVRWPWYHDQPRKIWLNYPTHQSVVGEWVPLFPSESIYALVLLPHWPELAKIVNPSLFPYDIILFQDQVESWIILLYKGFYSQQTFVLTTLRATPQ